MGEIKCADLDRSSSFSQALGDRLSSSFRTIMSAKDRFHDLVKVALIQEGWTITHDPLYLDFDSARIQNVGILPATSLH